MVALCAFLFTTVFSDARSLGFGSNAFRDIDVSNFSLPAYLGYVKNIYKAPSDNGRSPVIIHIQDAHCNYQAQYAISRTIDYFHKTYGIRQVNLEGGEGEYDISAFTKMPDLSMRQEASDCLLRAGIISGSEFYAIMNPENVRLFGVEDTSLYLKNLSIYRDSLKHKTEVDRSLAAIGYYLSRLKAKLYSKELLELDNKRHEFKNGTLGLKAHIDYLRARAAGNGVDISELGTIGLLAAVFTMESKIDFKKATLERDQLIEALTKLLSKHENDELVRKVVEFKAGLLAEFEFYNYIASKTKDAKADISSHSNLSAYIDYITQYSRVNKEELYKEIGVLDDKIEDGLCRNEGQRMLARLSKRLELIKNIFAVTITPDELSHYQNNKTDFDIALFTRFIVNEAPKFSIEVTNLPDAKLVNGYLEKAASFYDASYERDEEFVKRILSSSRPGAKTILVTGGFHTPSLERLFKKNNISYISIIPNFGLDNIQRPYFELLSGKSPRILSYMGTNVSTIAVYTYLCRNSGMAHPSGEIAALKEFPNVIPELSTKGRFVIELPDRTVTFVLSDQRVDGEEVGMIGNRRIYATTVISPRPGDQSAPVNLDGEAVSAFNTELLAKSRAQELAEAKKEWSLYRIEYLAEGGKCRFGHFIRWRLTFKNGVTGELITDLGSEEVSDTLGLTTADRVEQFKKDRKKWIDRLEALQRFKVIVGQDRLQVLSSFAHPNDSLALPEGQKVDEIFAQLEPTIDEYQSIEETLPVLDRPRLVQKYLGEDAKGMFSSIRRKLPGGAVLEPLTDREREVALEVRARLESAQTFLASSRMLWSHGHVRAANELGQDLHVIENASLSNYYLAEMYAERLRQGNFQVLDFGAGRSGFYSKITELLGEAAIPATSRIIDADLEGSGIRDGTNPNKVIIDGSAKTVSAQPKELEDVRYNDGRRYAAYNLIVSNFALSHLTPQQIKDFLIMSFRLLRADGEVAIGLPRNVIPSDSFLKGLEQMGWEVAQNQSARVNISKDTLGEVAKRDGRAVARELKALVERDFQVLILKKGRNFLELEAQNLDAGLFVFNKMQVARNARSSSSARKHIKLDFDHIEAMHILADNLKLKDIILKDPQTGGKIAPVPKDLSSITPKWPSIKPSRLSDDFNAKMKKEYVSLIERALGKLSLQGTRKLDDPVPDEDVQSCLGDLNQFLQALGVAGDDIFENAKTFIGDRPPKERTLAVWHIFVSNILTALNKETLMDQGWFWDVLRSAHDSVVLVVGRVHSFNIIESEQGAMVVAVISDYYSQPEDKRFFRQQATAMVVGKYVVFEYETNDGEGHLQKTWEGFRDDCLLDKDEIAAPFKEDAALAKLDLIIRGGSEQSTSIADRLIDRERERYVARIRETFKKTPSVSNISRAVTRLGFDGYKKFLHETEMLRAWKSLCAQIRFQQVVDRIDQGASLSESADMIFADLPKHPVVNKFKEWLVLEFKGDANKQDVWLGALLTARLHMEMLLSAPSYEVFIIHLYQTMYFGTMMRKGRMAAERNRQVVGRDSQMHESTEERVAFLALYLIDRYAANDFKKARLQAAMTDINLRHIATCNPKELFTMLSKPAVKPPASQAQGDQEKRGSNIGKFTESDPVGVNGESRLTGIIEHVETGDRIDLAKVEQRMLSPNEVEALIASTHLLIEDLSDFNQAEAKQYLRRILGAFTQRLPKHIIAIRSGKQAFFGRGQRDLIIIDEEIMKNPVSFLHEIIECLIDSDIKIANSLENLLDGSARRWLNAHQKKYADDGQLAYFMDNRDHFVVRAFTRQVFKGKDMALSTAIKSIQEYRLRATRYKGRNIKEMGIEALAHLEEFAIKPRLGYLENLDPSKMNIERQHMASFADYKMSLVSDLRAIEAELRLRREVISHKMAECIRRSLPLADDNIDEVNKVTKSILDSLIETKQYYTPYQAVVWMRYAIAESYLSAHEKNVALMSLRAVLGADAMGKIRPCKGRPLDVVVQCVPLEILALGINKTMAIERAIHERGYGSNAMSIIGSEDELMAMIDRARSRMGTDKNASTLVYLPASNDKVNEEMMERISALGDSRIHVQHIEDISRLPDLATRFELGLRFIDYDRLSAEEKRTPPPDLLNFLAAATDFDPEFILRNLFKKDFIFHMKKIDFKDREEWKLAQDIVRRAL